MSSPDSSLRSERIGSALVMHVEGRTIMTRAIENVVRSIIETETGFTRLILDISSCDYISSEGLGAIVSLWKTHQNTFVIVISPEDDSSIADLFEMTGLSRVLKGAVYVSLEEALAVG